MSTTISLDLAHDADGPPEQARGVSYTDDPVKDYLRGIGKTPLLNAEQEVELAKRIEAGVFAAELLSRGKPPKNCTRDELEFLVRDGQTATRHMVQANLRLVVSVAKRYVGRGILFEDLVQEGNLGLMHAVEKFDYTKGFKFSTYATWWIKQAITRAVASGARTIRVPVHMVEQINRLDRVRRALFQSMSRDPDPSDIAEAMGVRVEKVLEIIQYARHPVSLHVLAGEEGNVELGDLIEDVDEPRPESHVEHSMMAEALREFVDSLGDRERTVILMRFGLLDGIFYTLEQVGSRIGLTRERVRQIEKKALERLREWANANPELRVFLTIAA